MSSQAPIEYTDIRRVEGPLLVVAGVDGVGWDEDAEILLERATVSATASSWNVIAIWP